MELSSAGGNWLVIVSQDPIDETHLPVLRGHGTLMTQVVENKFASYWEMTLHVIFTVVPPLSAKIIKTK